MAVNTGPRSSVKWKGFGELPLQDGEAGGPLGLSEVRGYSPRTFMRLHIQLAAPPHAVYTCMQVLGRPKEQMGAGANSILVGRDKQQG